MEDEISMAEYIHQWRKEAIRVERERQLLYPNSYSFVFKDEGGDLEDNTL